ncbi:MAG TPA: hypothetical protein VHS78_00575 [Candidatus Elarobacter sp.]|jgi:uncharacterized repeat protein (TIGR01451 family)|nr:hypothetical protein [Candidatus Elarobacter sp.]
MRTLTEVFAPGAPSLPEGLRTLVVSPDRTVEPGATVRATFAFYNFGGAAATGLRVRFNLPEGLRYVPGTARVDDRPLDDLRGETALLGPNGADVGEVPPGVERRIALSYVVAPTIENGALLDLQAALASNETDVIGSNVVHLVASSAPQLENPETVTSLEAVRVAEPGEEVHVSARVHNSGHATAHDIVVVLPVPDRTTYIEGSARIDGRELPIDERGGDPFGFGNATIATPSLAAGATLVVEYRARIDSPLDDNTRIVLTGAVASAETAEFELSRAELTVRSTSRFDTEATRLVVDAPSEVEPGRRVRVALIAENAGTCAAEDVRVRLTLPEGLRYAPGSRAIDGRSASESETPGSFVFARIDADRRVEAAIDAYVVSPAVDGTPLPITASLQWPTGSRTFERTLVVRSSPRFLDTRNVLTLDGPAQVTPSSEVRATLRIANDGTAQATGVRIVVEADPALQLLRYADDAGEARVQPAGIDVGTLAPGATRTFALIGTVASPIADRFAIRLRARLENDQTPAAPLGQIELVVRSRPRFAPASSSLAYPAGEPLRPSGHGDIQVVVVNEGTDTARDTRLALDITNEARIEAVDGATRVGTTLLFGDVPPGARAEATVRLRLARLVPRGTAITVNGRLEAVGLLPLALAPVTIPTIAEPRFDQGAMLRTQPSDTVDAGEPLYVRLAVRNTGDGAASRLVVRGQLPPHTAYLPGTTAVNEVVLLDVDGGSVLWSKTGLVLEDVDPGVEIVVRYGTVVNTPLAAGTLIDAHMDLGWDGGGALSVSSPAARVRSTPAFAVRASGLPFSVSGIAPRTVDVLQEIAEQRRAAQQSQLPGSPLAALPPATLEPPPAPGAPPVTPPPAAWGSPAMPAAPFAEPPAPAAPPQQAVPPPAAPPGPAQAPPAPPQQPARPAEAARPPERPAFRYEEEAIEARFMPAPPPPVQPAPEPPAALPEPPVTAPEAAAPAAPETPAVAPPPAAPAAPAPQIAAPAPETAAPAPESAVPDTTLERLVAELTAPPAPPRTEPAEAQRPPEASQAAAPVVEPPPAASAAPTPAPLPAVEAQPAEAPATEAAAPQAPAAEAPSAAIAEPAMPDADVAAGSVAALPQEPDHVDEVATAQAPSAAAAEPVAPPAAAAPAAPAPATPAAAAPTAAAPAPETVAPPPEPVRAAEPAVVAKRVRLVFARDALERALQFLEQSDYGGLITHLFAIRTLLPTAFIGLNGDIPGKLVAEREALRGVIDRLFIKMRMPRYALTGKDLEDRSSRSALAELVRALEDAKPAEETEIGDAAVVLEGPIEVSHLLPHVAALESEPLGSARPWLILAELLPSTFVRPRGGEAMNTYRSALIGTFTNVAALPFDEFHRVLAGTQNAALDAALRDVRLALRDALEAAAAKA